MTKTLPDDRPLSAGEVARRLGVSPAWIGRLAARGAIPFTPTAVGRLYRLADVEALARQRGEAAKDDRRVKSPPAA